MLSYSRKNPRNTYGNMRVTSALLLLALGTTGAQDLGTHTLPLDLADASAKVLGALNKAPGNNRNLGYSEGPVGDTEGNLYFTEDNAGAGNIWKVTPSGVGSNFYNGPGMPNGLEFDNAGKLFSAEKGGIAKYDKSDSKTRTMIAMNPALNADFRVNDLSIASNGGMYFTNHANGHQFFFRDATGKVTTYEQGGSLGVNTPNGVEYIEEKKILLVTGDGADKVFKFDVKDDGTVSNRTEFIKTIKEPDGLTVDEKGNVYVASYDSGSVYVYGPNGSPTGEPYIGKIKIGNGGGGNASNCTFGGVDNKTLFITGNGGAYKVQLKVAGRKRPGSTHLRYRLAIPTSSPNTAADGYSINGKKISGEKPSTLLLLSIPELR
jgi:gluconolactonase